MGEKDTTTRAINSNTGVWINRHVDGRAACVLSALAISNRAAIFL